MSSHESFKLPKRDRDIASLQPGGKYYLAPPFASGDIYVDHLLGSNTNDGLTSSTAVKTIYYASTIVPEGGVISVVPNHFYKDLGDARASADGFGPGTYTVEGNGALIQSTGTHSLFQGVSAIGNGELNVQVNDLCVAGIMAIECGGTIDNGTAFVMAGYGQSTGNVTYNNCKVWAGMAALYSNSTNMTTILQNSEVYTSQWLTYSNHGSLTVRDSEVVNEDTATGGLTTSNNTIIPHITEAEFVTLCGY